tara:strand:- start:154 stop:492 length:339 start_codon:yes stop_codon:yes gene_type:complete
MKSEFEVQLRTHLLSAERNIDPQMAGQLTAARKRALNTTANPWVNRFRKAVWPTAGMALASALVVMVILMPLSPHQIPDKLAVDNQGNDSLELLENLDFYYWLAENESNLRS